MLQGVVCFAIKPNTFICGAFEGEKAIRDLAYRIPVVNETNPLVKEPTIASLMCAIYQLCIRNEKNARCVISCFICVRVSIQPTSILLLPIVFFYFICKFSI